MATDGVYGGEIGKPGTLIALVKSLVDVVNRDYALPSSQRATAKIDDGTYSVFEGDGDVASVQCFRNMCALRRRVGGEFAPDGCLRWETATRPTLNARVRCAAGTQ